MPMDRASVEHAVMSIGAIITCEPIEGKSVTDNEAITRIAERISDHDILNPNQLWQCKFCGTWGQGMRDFAYHVTYELAVDLGVDHEQRWVPTAMDGTQLEPVESFREAQYAMRANRNVNRVDREYRFASRWFRPSREG
jgi:hypothetical protein